MKKILLFLTLFTGMTLTGCNDSFLEKYPVTSLTEENAFQSYDNFKAFMWPCYEMFSNTNIATSTTAIGRNSHYLGDVYAGYLEQRGASSQNKYAFQTVTNATSGNGWNFSSFIRRINIMLSHVDDSNMTEEEKNHWKSVGYFFHSFWYMELIDRFGDVPWVDTPLDDTSEEAYGSRMPRLEVADKVLDRLLWAESNIGNTAIYEKRMVLTLSTRTVYEQPFPASLFGKVLGESTMNWEVTTDISQNVSAFETVDARLSFSVYRNRRTTGCRLWRNVDYGRFEYSSGHHPLPTMVGNNQTGTLMLLRTHFFPRHRDASRNGRSVSL